MVIQRSLQALIAIWHELPRLVGVDWTVVLPRLRALLRQVQSASDPLERDWLVTDVLGILRPYSRAALRLDEVRLVLGMETGHRGEERIQPTPPPPWTQLLAGVRNRLEPNLETRFTDVAVPAHLPVGERGTVAFRLTLDEPAHSRRPEELVVKTDQTYDVQLVSLDEHVEILGDPNQQLLVERGLDSEAVVFFVLGTSTGRAMLRLLLRHEGHLAADLSLTLEIGPSSGEDAPEAKPLRVQQADPEIAPVDLDFQVLLRPKDGQTAFRYVFHSPTGAVGVHGFDVAGPTLMGSPEVYQARLWRTLESSRSAAHVSALGERLFDELLPDEARDVWREAVGSSARTLQITSDEPWIPWELLRPDLNGDDERFLCERFHTARWLSGGKPASRIVVSDLACLEAPPGRRGEADATRSDRVLLADMARRHRLNDLSPVPSTPDGLFRLLDRGVDLMHFASYREEPGSDEAYGEMTPTVPLEGGVFRTLDLDRQRRRTVARKRPLVVFNVGGSGRHVVSLTALEGWAETWIRRAGCGAFLAPLWRTDGGLARAFVEEVYGALESGEPLGRAVTAARRAVRELEPEGAAWLTFAFYGHPNSCIHLGADDSPGVQSED